MSLPTKELLPKKAILIQKVVPKEECQKYIDASEKKGFAPGAFKISLSNFKGLTADQQL